MAGGHFRRIDVAYPVNLSADGAQFLICRMGGGMWSDGAEFSTTLGADIAVDDDCSLGIDLLA